MGLAGLTRGQADAVLKYLNRPGGIPAWDQRAFDEGVAALRGEVPAGLTLGQAEGLVSYFEANADRLPAGGTLVGSALDALRAALRGQEVPAGLTEDIEEAFAVLTDRTIEDFLARVRAGNILQNALNARSVRSSPHPEAPE